MSDKKFKKCAFCGNGFVYDGDGAMITPCDHFNQHKSCFNSFAISNSEVITCPSRCGANFRKIDGFEIRSSPVEQSSSHPDARDCAQIQTDINREEDLRRV